MVYFIEDENFNEVDHVVCWMASHFEVKMGPIVSHIAFKNAYLISLNPDMMEKFTE